MIEFKTVVPRDPLLEALKNGREQHAKMLKESIKGYCAAAATACRAMAAQLDGGDPVTVCIALDPPVNRLSDYDHAIQMIECTEEKSFELDAEQFQCFMLDDWEWQQRWLLSNRKFSRTTANYASAKHIS